MSVSATTNLSFIGFGFVGNSTPTHMVENGCFFFVCIAWELAVHAAVGEVRAYAMSVVVDDGVFIFIISLSVNVLIDGYFGFRRFDLSTLFLMLKFCVVDFFHQFVYFGSEVLVL